MSKMPKDKAGEQVPPLSPSTKRSLPSNSTTSPAKKQTKWTALEDAKIIELRGQGKKWDDISKALPGRSAISCRLHYQNYLERRSEWDDDRKDHLARLYERFKKEMWMMIEAEMKIPWRACEAMHWQMGEDEMARRAGVKPFSSSSSVALEPPPKHKRGNGNGNGNSAPAHKGNPGCSGTVEAVAPGASETSTGGNGVSKK